MEYKNLKEDKYEDLIIIDNLFSNRTYQDILDFMENNINFFPMQIDTNQFIRKSIHNLPFFVNIHNQLIELASYYFKEKVKPSYCFLSMYKQNGICPLHIDRDQCRYTIDYLISSTQKDPWPIHIGKQISNFERKEYIEKNIGHPESEDDINNIISKESFTTVNLNPNDAVLYSGTHQWHYRSDRLQGEANLVFFHFVPEDFNGQLG